MTPMTLELVRDALGWCAVLNLVVLASWFATFSLAHDTVHRIHYRWFKVTEERFDAIHYKAMITFKLAWLFLNIVPYLALRIIV